MAVWVGKLPGRVEIIRLRRWLDEEERSGMGTSLSSTAKGGRLFAWIYRTDSNSFKPHISLT